ncbi:MAG TPA: transporter substrate-binding domain-containing protein [Candidatus Binatia bacterium]|nr:transporter substrate-binding domain-containing protein [Candidatus Binatia bacterium]
MLLFVTIAPLLAAEKPAKAELPVEYFAQRKLTGDFDAMLKRRYMRVLVVNSKMLYFVDRGRQGGLTYEIFKRFEDEVNREQKNKRLRFHVVFIPVPRDQLVPKLAAGFGDVAAANLTVTPERERRVAFSAPAVKGINEIAVTGPQSPPIAGVEDLSGKEVFVRKSSSYYEHLVELNRELARRGKPAVILNTAPEELEDEDLLEMVNAGLVEIVVVDDHIARFWSQVFDDIHLRDDVVIHEGGEIAWMMRKKSPKLKAALDRYLARHGLRQAFGNDVLRRYLKDAKYVKDAAAEAEMRKFRKVVEFFQKYGDKYHVEPLLMAAQGYQESQLDQSKRSPAGAIGVMQVLPATGKQLGVGDITSMEPNVHAGVKYIRLMINQYYGNEPMDDMNKVLFAFAAYNAGPTRIGNIRRQAAKRGLDPNRWFDNVEIVAAEKIGRETVQYVSNIYKYYVAYKLTEESRLARQAAKQTVNGNAR